MGELQSLYLSKKKTISTFNLSNLLKLTIFSTFGEYSVNACSDWFLYEGNTGT